QPAGAQDLRDVPKNLCEVSEIDKNIRRKHEIIELNAPGGLLFDVANHQLVINSACTRFFNHLRTEIDAVETRRKGSEGHTGKPGAAAHVENRESSAVGDHEVGKLLQDNGRRIEEFALHARVIARRELI